VQETLTAVQSRGVRACLVEADLAQDGAGRQVVAGAAAGLGGVDILARSPTSSIAGQSASTNFLASSVVAGTLAGSISRPLRTATSDPRLRCSGPMAGWSHFCAPRSAAALSL
jgi:hypothetical protein